MKEASITESGLNPECLIEIRLREIFQAVFANSPRPTKLESPPTSVAQDGAFCQDGLSFAALCQGWP